MLISPQLQIHRIQSALTLSSSSGSPLKLTAILVRLRSILGGFVVTIRLVGRPEGKRMTIEIALLVVCGVLVSALIWRLNRALRVLGEIQGEVNALRDLVSRVFLMQLNRKTENSPPA